MRPSWRSQGLSTGLRVLSPSQGGNTTSGAPLLWTAVGLHPAQHKHPQPQCTARVLGLPRNPVKRLMTSPPQRLFQRLEDTQLIPKKKSYIRALKRASIGASPGETSGSNREDHSPPLRTLQNPAAACHMNSVVGWLVWSAVHAETSLGRLGNLLMCPKGNHCFYGLMGNGPRLLPTGQNPFRNMR